MRSTLTLTALALSITAGSAVANDLLVAGASGIIHTINLVDGSVDALPTVTESVISGTVHDGVLYMGTLDSEIVSFDLESNSILDRFEIPADATAIAWDGFHLVAGTESGAVYTVNHETGAIVSTIEQVGTDVTAIGIDAGGVFVGGQSTLAMRTHIGQENFQFFAACGSMINSMAFGPDTMYLGGTTFFGDDAGTIYRFDKFVGGVNYAGTYTVDSDATATLEYDGRLFVGGSNGQLLELDPEVGTVLRTFNIGTPIHAVLPVNGTVTCPADYDTSGTLDIFDVVTFLELFHAALPSADTTGDGVHDIFDVNSFVGMFISGCQ